METWRVEMLAGDTRAAERELRRAYDLLCALGEKYLLSTVAGLLGQTLYALGRYDEVEELGRLAQELATDDDVETQALWRCVHAKLSARQGAHDEAEALARDALEILAPTDAIILKYGALLDLAEVLGIAGRPEEAAIALQEALQLAELKGAP